MADSIVRTFLLAVATVLLGLSPLGFVSVPGFGEAITFLHLPMILAATLESPLAAALVGSVFGLMAGLKYNVPPLAVHVLVRTVAGLLAGITFQVVKKSASEGSKVTIASVAAAVAGTAANTFLMSLAVLAMGLSDLGTLLSVALVHGGIEMAAALVVTTPLTIALKGRSE